MNEKDEVIVREGKKEKYEIIELNSNGEEIGMKREKESMDIMKGIERLIERKEKGKDLRVGKEERGDEKIVKGMFKERNYLGKNL